MPKYRVNWKISDGSNATTGSYFPIEANSEIEAREKAEKRIKSQHQGNFKKGWEIVEMKVLAN